MNKNKNWKAKTIVNSSIAAIIVIALTVTMASAFIGPVTVEGTVMYSDGTYVPAGWNVSMENLNESYLTEPWTGTTGFYPPCWNYTVVGSADASSRFIVNVSDPTGMYTGSASFTAAGFDSKIVNITIGILSVTVEYPNGGEEIPIGDVVEVSASAADDTEVVSVDFSYSADNGTTWNTIGAGTRVSGDIKSGTWNVSWDTAGLPIGTEYLIKAVATDNEANTAEDASDSTFSLVDEGNPLYRNAKATPSTILFGETTEVIFEIEAADKESEVSSAYIKIPAGLGVPTGWKAMNWVENYTEADLTWEIYNYTASLTPAAEYTFDFNVAISDIAGNTDTTHIYLKAVTTQEFNITLYNGWNLISLPLLPSDTAIDEVIPAETAENGDWIYADTPGEELSWKYAKYWDGWDDYGSGLLNLTPGEGYLYNREGEQVNLTIIGEPISSMNTTIYTEWNLVGYAGMESPSLGDIINEPYNGDWIYADTPGEGLGWKYAKYWDGWDDYGSGLTNLTAGEGYLYNREGPLFYWVY